MTLEAENKSRRKVIDVAEYGEIGIPIDELFTKGKLNLYPEVVGKKYFSFYLKKDSLIFQAGGYVGLIPINDRITLDVRPRVPVQNLERILQMASEVPVTLGFVREYATHIIASASLIDILARSLLGGIVEIERYGIYKQYVSRTVNTSFPRGRIMLGSTIQKHLAQGRNHSVTASWFEHSADNGSNRCLKYAIWLLSQRYKSVNMQKGQRKIVSDLNQAYHLFDKTSLDKSISFLKDPLVIDPNRFPSIRAYYAPLLNLAKTIIENRGVSFSEKGSDMLLPSMIFDFDKVFEKYLRKVLQIRLQKLEPNFSVLDGTVGGIGSGVKLLFDKSPRKVEANPDIVIKRKDTNDPYKVYPILVDAKYKPVDFPERSDINQGIGYGFSYRCRNVVLAHPKREGGRKGLHLIGTIGDYNFYQYIFDMDCENPEDEENRFATSLYELSKDTTDTAVDEITQSPTSLSLT